MTDTKILKFDDQKPNIPKEITLSFIKDYKIWSDFASKLENRREAKGRAIISDSYDNIIKKYCTTDKKRQPIAYSSDSMHSLDVEAIESETEDNNKCFVKTKVTLKHPPFSTHGYEYVFIKKDSWYLEEVFYIDRDGTKAPSL